MVLRSTIVDAVVAVPSMVVQYTDGNRAVVTNMATSSIWVILQILTKKESCKSAPIMTFRLNVCIVAINIHNSTVGSTVVAGLHIGIYLFTLVIFKFINKAVITFLCLFIVCPLAVDLFLGLQCNNTIRMYGTGCVVHAKTYVKI